MWCLHVKLISKLALGFHKRTKLGYPRTQQAFAITATGRPQSGFAAFERIRRRPFLFGGRDRGGVVAQVINELRHGHKVDYAGNGHR